MRISPNASPEEQRRLNEYWGNLRNKKKPMQAAPSAQQALPQPQMPPELQRLQDMSNALGKRIQSDPSMQRFQEQQRQIYSSIQQKTQNYINSLQQFLNTAPPEFRQFLSSPQTLSRLRMAYGEQLPEMNQVRNIGRQIQQYHQNTYGQEIQKIQQLQMQAAPQIQQYQNQMQLFNQQQSTALANAQQQIRELRGQTPTIVRNDYDYLPEGLTQEEFMKQARVNMTQQYRTPEQMREYFKPLYDSYLKEKALEKAVAERVYPRPVQPPQQDPIVDPKRPSTTVPKTITPIERPPVQPTVDPVREPFIPKPEVDPSETLPPPTRVEKPTVRPIVDPKREPFKPNTPTSDDKGMKVDPLRPTIKLADTTGVKHSGQGLGGQGGLPSVTPIKGSGPKMIVDPLRPTTSVPKHSGEGIGGQGGIPALPNRGPQMTVDPLRPSKPAEQPPGIMPKSPKKRKAGLAPSQYRGIDTNVRGLMRQ